MILPNKHLSISKCLLGSGAKVMEVLITPATVSSLWEKVKKFPEVQTFDKFVLTLSLLYTLDAIEFSEGLIRKVLK
jgi:hypothetical protein